MYICDRNCLYRGWRIGQDLKKMEDNETLSKFNDWSSIAKTYISRHREGINVEELLEEYSKDVTNFHSWLFVAVFDKYGQDIAEYLNYMRLIKGFSSESNWKILINQVVKQKQLNPYLYLNQYLQDDQIEYVFFIPSSFKATDR